MEQFLTCFLCTEAVDKVTHYPRISHCVQRFLTLQSPTCPQVTRHNINEYEYFASQFAYDISIYLGVCKRKLKYDENTL